MKAEDANRRVAEAVTEIEEFFARVKRLPSGEPVNIPLNIVRHMPLIASFLLSKPYTTVDYEEETFGLSLYSRVDIMDAFKKHALAVLTDVCPDCGKPMAAHREDDEIGHQHESSDRLN